MGSAAYRKAIQDVPTPHHKDNIFASFACMSVAAMIIAPNATVQVVNAVATRSAFIRESKNGRVRRTNTPNAKYTTQMMAADKVSNSSAKCNVTTPMSLAMVPYMASCPDRFAVKFGELESDSWNTNEAAIPNGKKATHVTMERTFNKTATVEEQSYPGPLYPCIWVQDS